MQEGRCHECGINKTLWHRVTFKGNFRSCAQTAVVLRMVAFAKPCIKAPVHFLQRVRAVEVNLIQKSVQSPVKAFLLSLAFGIPGLCVNESDTEQIADATHPVGTVLPAVVKIQTARCSVLRNGLVQCVLHNTLLHVVIKFAVDNVACGIVNQAAEISGFLLTVHHQHGTVFNVALPQIKAVLALKSLGAIAGVLVDLHHAGRIPSPAHGILQSGTLQFSWLYLSLQFQNTDDGGNAATGLLPAEQDCFVNDVFRNSETSAITALGNKRFKAILFIGCKIAFEGADRHLKLI